MKVELPKLILFVFLLTLLGCQVGAQNYHQYGLRVLTNADGCAGGEICAKQPVIAVTLLRTGEIAYSVQGSAFVNIGSSPTGYERLYIGTGCDHQSCGEIVVNTVASFPIVNGIASFEVLFMLCCLVLMLIFRRIYFLRPLDLVTV
jgi:hypothetical protein